MIYIIFSGIGFLAFFLKGFMGVGMNTVVIALSSFFIDPKLTIVLASFVSIFGGLGMLHIDREILKPAYWLPITITMMIGGICGALALKYIDAKIFEIILGAAFLLVSVWMTFSPAKRNDQSKEPPEKASLIDNAMGWVGGFCNGFIGLSAVPVISYFGIALDKKHLRRFLVLAYLPVSVAQTVTFSLNGMMTKDVVFYGLIMLPFMVIGLFVGNKVHNKVSEVWFRRILGAFLIFVSIKLII